LVVGDISDQIINDDAKFTDETAETLGIKNVCESIVCDERERFRHHSHDEIYEGLSELDGIFDISQMAGCEIVYGFIERIQLILDGSEINVSNIVVDVVNDVGDGRIIEIVDGIRNAGSGLIEG
jgi:hypothetical protein